MEDGGQWRTEVNGGQRSMEDGGQWKMRTIDGGGDGIGGMPRAMITMVTVIIIAIRRAGSGNAGGWLMMVGG